MKRKTDSTTHVTIYSRVAHMTQKHSGQTASITVPKSILLNSVVVTSENGSIVPFSFVPSSVRLTDRSTGKRLFVNVEKGSNIFSGEVLSLTDADARMIMADSSVMFVHNYDTATIRNGSDSSQPQLVFSTLNKDPFTVSFLMSGMSWLCTCTAFLSPNSEEMTVRLAGSITNDTEADIIASKARLVAGDVFQPEPVFSPREMTSAESHPVMLQSAAMRPTSSSPFGMAKKLEDYVSYDIGERVIRAKDVAEIGFFRVSVQKVYLHSTHQSNVTSFQYQFKTPQFIPNSDVFVYKEQKDAPPSFVGASAFRERQKGEKVKIPIGLTSELRCTTEIITREFPITSTEEAKKWKLEWEKLPQESTWFVVDEEVKLTIVSHRKVASKLKIKHFIGNRTLLESPLCMNGGVQKGDKVVWNVEVTPNRTSQFQCVVTTLRRMSGQIYI